MLLSLLLEPAAAALPAVLIEALATDPALALWASYHHAVAHRGDCDVPTLAELARWMGQHLLALLNSLEDLPSSDETLVAPEPNRLAARAALDVAAATANVRKRDPLQDPRYLAVLLRSVSDEWLAFGGSAKEFAAAWPGWLGKILHERPAGATSPTTAAIAGSKRKPVRPAASRIKPTTAKKYSAGSLPERARQRWLAPAGFAARNFSTVVARLTKLASLEARFDERLEEEKLEALAEFAAGAGHEINNPLAVISGRAQLFLRHEQDPERRRELAVINTQALRVHEMIADLMLFARPPQPRLAHCDVTELIDVVVSELAPRAEEAGVALDVTLAEELPSIQADATQLQVALRAVMENALDAMTGRGESGRIEITAVTNPPPFQNDASATNSPAIQGGARGGLELSEPRAAQLALILTIRDNGPGMPAEVRRHAFDPFYSGRGAGRGLGNGLSKCWRIVTAHGGRVDIDTSTTGTTVTIGLPANKDFA